jgi:hypothetical protein
MTVAEMTAGSEQEGRPASSQDFILCETVAANPTAVQDDGTVLIQIIRPGIGRGKGSHLYEANMLERNAEVFAGWKMYIDHEMPDARKKRGGLPRSMDEVGGRVLESWWDSSVPANEQMGWGQGAVVGRVRPVRKIRDLIEDDPGLVEASIAATATAVKPVTRNGKKVWLVEGIEPHGTVDWVSEAGAGGKVLTEAAVDTEEEVAFAAMDSMTDEELVDYIRNRNPVLAESLIASPQVEESVEEGGTNMGLTPETLREALDSDDVRTYVRDLVEAQVADERELIRADARAESERQIELRDLRDEAVTVIREAGLPEAFETKLMKEYELEGSYPSDKLDVYDEVNDEGDVTKSASQALRESLDSDLREQAELLAAARPTRVRGQGPTRIEESESEVPKADTPKSFWREHLASAGIDPDAAFAPKSDS